MGSCRSIHIISYQYVGGKIFVQGASRCTLNSMDDFYEIADMGNRNRATATTNMNDQSSRSHAVMIVNIASPTPIENDNTTLPLPPGTDGSLQNNSNTVLRESNLMLVDLAGSERASATSKLNSIRSDEGIAINLSLSALGNCISALASNNSGTSASHVPFRDSKLTRLLQVSCFLYIYICCTIATCPICMLNVFRIHSEEALEHLLWSPYHLLAINTVSFFFFSRMCK